VCRHTHCAKHSLRDRLHRVRASDSQGCFAASFHCSVLSSLFSDFHDPWRHFDSSDFPISSCCYSSVQEILISFSIFFHTLNLKFTINIPYHCMSTGHREVLIHNFFIIIKQAAKHRAYIFGIYIFGICPN
jgi:hypothetical protein